ncbi:hypothetical protein GCM10010954_02450 [Halobacillus andaensis]|uniref:Uncharacterized protein n=1 Tax=Halobacillus andaensis TaxID=1176239 RepID=A0A917AZZ9_HALAA|nr:hypothetical protein [Halobacillus andaensis]MBP2003034.1 hypothetical protein [Halobacillus andaensis]GGF07503.1 hypothetical protein GCM10010954_02450 [Halobacillus andaensis]
MKILVLIMCGLFLFVGGSLYGIKHDTQGEPVQEAVNKETEITKEDKACGSNKYSEDPPFIAEVADGLGEGVSHGFDFILLLLYSFVGSS